MLLSVQGLVLLSVQSGIHCLYKVLLSVQGGIHCLYKVLLSAQGGIYCLYNVMFTVCIHKVPLSV